MVPTYCSGFQASKGAPVWPGQAEGLSDHLFIYRGAMKVLSRRDEGLQERNLRAARAISLSLILCPGCLTAEGDCAWPHPMTADDQGF